MAIDAPGRDILVDATSADPDGRLVRWLTTFLMPAAVCYWLAAFLAPGADRLRATILLLVYELGSVVVLALLRADHPRRAAAVLLAVFWATMTGAALTGFGVKGQAYNLGYGITILTAGLFFGARGALRTALLCLASGFVMVLGEAVGWLQPHLKDSSWQLYGASAIYLPTIAVVQHLASYQTRAALAVAEATAEARREVLARLARAEAQFGSVADSLPGVIFRYYLRPSGESGLYYVSEQWTALLGLRRDPARSLVDEFAAHLHPDDRERFGQSVSDSFQQVGEWAFEGRFIRPDGRLLYLRCRGASQHLDDEVITDGVILDVTAEKEAEEARARTQGLLESALEQMPVGVLVADATDGEIRFVNSAAREFLGEPRPLAETELAFDDVTAFRPDGTAYRWEETPLARALRHGEQVRGQEMRLCRGGRETWQLVDAGPIYGPDGELTAAIAVMQDITARRQLEQARARSDARLAGVMDTVPQALVFTELETGRILAVNDACLELFRWTRAECEGRTSLEMGLYWQPEDRLRMVDEVRRRGNLAGYEIRMRRGDGTPIDMLIWSRTLEHADPPAAIWACADISARTELEALRRAETEMLRRQYLAVCEIAGHPAVAEGRFDDAVEAICRSIVEALQGGRGAVFLLDDQRRSMSCVMLHDGVRALPLPPDVFTSAAHGILVDGYVTERVLCIADTSSDPRLTEAAMASFRARGITAALGARVVVDGRLVGVLSCSVGDGPRVWQPHEQSFMAQMADQLSLCLQHAQRREMVEALERRERNYRELFSALEDAVLVLDPADMRLLDVNEAAERTFLRPRADLLQCSLADLGAPESGCTEEQSREQVCQAMATGRVTCELLARRSDESRFPAEVRMIRTELGGQPRVVAIFRDLSELRAARALIEEQRERYERLFEDAPDAILILDDHGTVVDCNPTAETMFGRPRDELVGESIDRFTPPELPDGQMPTVAGKRYRDAAFAGRKATFEWRHLRPDGSTFDVEVNLSRLKLRDVPRLHAIVRDLTSRRQAEEALRESEERLRTLVGESSVGIALVDEHGRVATWNEALAEVTGVREAEALGQCIWDVQASFFPDLSADLSRLEAVAEATREALRTGRSRLFERVHQFRLARVTGGSRVVRQTVFPIRARDGWRLGTILADVTELVEAEEALRQREEQLDSLFRNMVEGVALHELVRDEQGRVVDYRLVDVNPQYSILLGLEREQVVGRLATEVYDAAEAPFLEQYAGVARTGDAVRFESEFPTMQRIFDISVVAWGRDGFATIFSDITARRAAEQALRENEALLRTVVSNLPVVIFAFDRDGVFTFSDGLGLEVLGLQPGQVVGESVYELYADHPNILEAIRGAFAGERRQDLALFGDQWFDAWYMPLERPDGTIDGVVGVAINVTEQQLAAQAVRENEAALTAIFEESPFVLMLTAEDGTFLRINRRFEERSGYLRDQVLGRRWGELTRFIEPASAAVLWEQLSLHREIDQLELRVRRADGTFSDGLYSSRVVMLQGRPCRLSVWQDISDRVAAEEELRRTVARLEQFNAEMERFTYTVSHDLKSPLITITGFVERLHHDLAAGRSDRVQRSIDRINAAADRMMRLLNELLELSRIGRLDNPPVPVAVAELVAEAAELVGGQLETQRVELRVADELPMVMVDRPRLVEVFQNLLDNAAKFAAGESPQVWIEALPPDPQTGWPRLAVRDNGSGFEPQYAERIFGLFDQLEPDRGGTGIGLALVKRIIETHGGRIEAHSEGPGCGATFVFSLPPCDVSEERSHE